MVSQTVASLDIVIVNWNSDKFLRTCVASIPEALNGQVRLNRLVVIDNASSDGLVANLVSDVVPLRVIRNAENRGFAAACNQGADETTASYLLFLNPDTQLFEDSLSGALAFMEAPGNEQVGICGIQIIDENTNIARTCSRFPSVGSLLVGAFGLDKALQTIFKGHFMREWNHDSVQIVEQVMGAFFLVRTSLWKQLGGFDERFFVYFEDVDFSLRAWKAGFSSVYLSTAHVFHKGGGTSEQIKGRRLYYSLRSRIAYVFKHFAVPQAYFLAVIFLFVEPFTRFAWATARLRGKELVATIKAYKLLYASMFRVCLRFPFVRSRR